MSTDQSKALNALLKKIKGTPVQEEPQRSPMEELVFSFMLWESTTPRALKAHERLMKHVVDVNELRVCRPPELVEVIGPDYPRADERVIRLRDTLHELYLREHEVSLERALALGKRDGRKYFDAIQPMPQFVAARVLIRCMGAHAVPLDERLHTLLLDAEVFPEPLEMEKAAAFLERHVKAAEAPAVHALLQAWSEENASRSGRASPRARKKTSTRKKATKPTTAEKPARKKPASRTARK